MTQLKTVVMVTVVTVVMVTVVSVLKVTIVIVTVVRMTLVTIVVVTVVIKPYFRKNNLTPQKPMRFLRAAFRDLAMFSDGFPKCFVGPETATLAWRSYAIFIFF